MVALPYTCKHCGNLVRHYGRCSCLPGTLTVTYAGRSVTIDPIDDDERFAANAERALGMLDEAHAEFVQFHKRQPEAPSD